MFGYLLESPHWGDSKKYPKHMFYEEIKIKKAFLHIILSIKNSLQQQIHFNGTNAVVVMRVHCTGIVHIKQYFIENRMNKMRKTNKQELQQSYGLGAVYSKHFESGLKNGFTDVWRRP